MTGMSPSPVPPTPSLSLDMRARQRIKNWMETSGITQTMLGDRIGKNQAWMSRYLAGEFDADLPTLQKMAAAFGHTLYALLDLAPEAPELRVIEMYRALPPRTRATVEKMLEALSQAPRGRRGPR